MKPALSVFSATALFIAFIPQSQAAVSLGTAASFGVLAGTQITNTGLTTVVGNIGVDPQSAITGFFGTLANEGPGTFTGTAYQDDITAELAKADAATAFNALNGLAVNTSAVAVELGGQTLSPGVYSLGTAEMTGILTLDGVGDYVFQIGSTLNTAALASVNLINGANPANVFWAVGSSASLGIGSSISGNIIALTSATLTTGASVNGRVIALNAAVTLDSNTIIPEPTTVSLLSILSLGLIFHRRRIAR
jgi:hypothetical protein